tara:strand:- start:795 stop:1523 length:729 start_codon:yes stop_codon:yes gene_type:complete
MESYKYLSDSSLKEINSSLDWHSGVELPDGRVLGSLTNSKRTATEPIPDYRVSKLDDLIGLKDKSVLELGCFEGAHTLSFLEYTDDVTAVDVRPQNVINTLTRLSVFGKKADVFVCNVEDMDNKLGVFDVIFHCGVLYHLSNPVEHFIKLKGMCKYMLLDTHIASDNINIKSITYKDKKYTGSHYIEGGWADPFSGLDKSAFWLSEESLRILIQEAGYKVEEEWETRKERNGLRISWLLKTK